MNKRYYLKSVGISITNPTDTIKEIEDQIHKKETAQICVINTRATYHAVHNEDYRRILNSSLLTLPDGKPLEIIGQLRGYKAMKRTSGPDLFTRVCKLSKDKAYTHFFYGCTDEILKKMKGNLRVKYPHLDIVGAVAPPFGSPEELASKEITDTINTLNPTFVWLGLGAPKQDLVANILQNSIKNSIIIGIGLVFEYEAGTVKKPPEWISNLGFEWLYRIFVQTRRAKHFIIPFLFMISRLIMESFKSIFRYISGKNKLQN